MNEITQEVFTELLKVCTKDVTVIDIIRVGVEMLQGKPISKPFKKQVLKTVLEKIARGRDNVANTEDDRLSKNTLSVLIMMVESEALDDIIEGIYLTVKHQSWVSKWCKFLMV
jgi:heterodisulfide reductase subunit C